MLTEIRHLIAETKQNYALPVETAKNEFPAWVIRSREWYGIGVPLEKFIEVSESFANVKLWSNYITIENKEVPVLLLTSDVESLRYEFAAVCAQFVDPGEDGRERRRLISEPASWWNNWKTLLGNAVHEKTPYSVLGELKTLEKLLDEGCTPVWAAKNRSTQDIEAGGCSYEVKATLNRYDNTVKINSQFQLQTNNKPLYLVFCRFEPSDNGISVSDMVNMLVSKGADENILNEGLSTMGFEPGSSARNEKYKLLEIRKYHAGKGFPRIDASSFKEGKLPHEITKITYEIDLTGLEYSNWND
ncbi:PD-(D/E)XK motif protein [Metabacillus indicus]|nr:PD-(D/E)XK motif protein [Metabacillus indicus]